jgi:hypothetical protein
MYIILRQAPSEIDKILNIFYSSDITPIRNWVKEYINEEIESYKYAPNNSNIKNVFYELNDGEFCFQLLKHYKKINKGYVYNSSEKMTDIIYSISILEFDSNHCKHLETSDMWRNVNQEVNNNGYTPSGYWNAVKLVPHYYKGIHPVRHNGECQKKLNDIVFNHLDEFLKDKDYTIEEMTEPYFAIPLL